MAFPKGAKRSGPGGKKVADPPDPTPAPSPSPPAVEPPGADPVAQRMKEAEKEAERTKAVEEKIEKETARQRACLSCGTILEDNECPECGARLVNGKFVTKKEPPKEKAKKAKGLFGGLFSKGGLFREEDEDEDEDGGDEEG